MMGELLRAAKELRVAQRAYMANRGNDAYGKIVAEKAAVLDMAIEMAETLSSEDYLVTEEAVYRHRILGLFDTLELAEARALEVAHQEDGHHEYVVWKVKRNESIEDPEPICEFRKRRIGNGWPRQWTEPKRSSRSVESK